MPDNDAVSKPELMAPGGGPEAAFAALQYGADAVYVGLRAFSARADAVNFTPEELDELTAYAHGLNPRRKVYAAVNTLADDAALGGVLETLAVCSETGVDAVIAQDLGVIRLARRAYPDLRLHASTQLAIHNLAGTLAAAELGLSRVTLARELTLEEIEGIASACPIEVEVFVHGALCYAYSGLCLFSSITRGRSGNRGQCAYPCRETFRAGDGGEALPYSMKDLAWADHIPALARAGVRSLKIEGRKKSARYVAAVTAYYRRLIDGSLSDADRKACEHDIRAIFSRPWTDLYAGGPQRDGVIDPAVTGHRGAPVGTVEATAGRGGTAVLRFQNAWPIERHDGLQVDLPGETRPYGFAVGQLRSARTGRAAFALPTGEGVEVELPPGAPTLPVGAPIYLASSQAVKHRYKTVRPRPGIYRNRTPVTVRVTLTPDTLRAEASTPNGEQAVVRRTGAYAAAREPEGTARAARAAFDKLGDTSFELETFGFENPENRFAPVSLLNAVRRELVDALAEAARAARRQRLRAILESPVEPAPPQHPRAQALKEALRWTARIDRLDYAEAWAGNGWREPDELTIDIDAAPADALEALVDRLVEARGAGFVRLALPAISRAWDIPDLRARIERFVRRPEIGWSVANLSGLTLLGPDRPADVTADWPLYACNREALALLTDGGFRGATLAPDDSIENMTRLLARAGDRLTVIVRQDTPLFLSASRPCARTGHEDTASPLCMRDRRNEGYLTISRAGLWITLGERPLTRVKDLPALIRAGARNLRVDFVYRNYEPGDIGRVWAELRGAVNDPRA